MSFSAPPRGRVNAAVLAFGLVASLAACTGGDEDDTADDVTPTPTPTAEAVALHVGRLGVRGDLSDRARSRVHEGITTSVEGYLQAALLGDYPRSDFTLAGFTKGAAQDARRDLDVLTGKAFADAESVTAKALKADVVVLAPEGRPAGATAKIRFALDVDGVPVVVRGRLLLTPDQGTWRIFGYDVSSNASDVAAAGGEG